MNVLLRRYAFTYKDLRALNRKSKFDEVIAAFETSSKLTQLDGKAKAQYDYALYRKNYLVSEPPPPPPTPQQVFGTREKPLVVKEHVTEDNYSMLFIKYSWLFIKTAAIGMFLYMWLSSQMPATDMFDSKKQIMVAEQSNITFDDIKGIDECRAELQELVEFLKFPYKFHKIGAKLPKGVLLTGKPGVGKTLLAKAIAGEAKVKFFYSSGSNFEEIFVGLGAKRVRELFSTAKANAPCIIFIDEIDALGSSRKSKEINHNRQSLNQLLVEMDGFKATDNVVVIAATNFPENLDNALTRAGRFDKTVDIPVPDVKGREQILDLYFNRVKYDQSVNINTIARGTTGMTGADLANLVNIAMLNGIKNGRTACSSVDVEYAIDRILMGVDRKSLVMTEDDKMNTAIHEIGHALISVLTEGAQPLHKTTILPRGQALGMTVMLPEKDELLVTRKQLLARIDVAMGGRAAEELFLGKQQLTTGCSSDLDNATRLAYFITRGGMFSEMTGVMSSMSLDSEGIEHRDNVDEVVKGILAESYERVKDKLAQHKGAIKKLAAELTKKETLSRDEFLEVFKQGD